MKYTKRFLAFIDELLRIEAGFVDHPSDPGGATNYGISLRFLQRVQPGATIEDVRRMTPARATALYFDHFWTPLRCEDLPPPVGEAMFSICVNLPMREAGEVLQRAINRVRPGLRVDGVIGPLTIAAAKACDQVELRRRLVAELCAYYHTITRSRSQFEAFIEGWFYRAACLFIA